MSYVFISYCRTSQETVKALGQDIGELGHRAWLDQQLSGGQAWWDQILAVIRECDVFVFALAPESLDSEACKREYKYASALNKPILPVLVADGVSANLLPPELSRLQHVDYRRQDKQAVIGVMRAFNALPKSPPLPDPLPDPPSPPLSYLGGLMEQIETTGELTFAQQAALVLKLKEPVGGVQNRSEVRTLLARLRKRDDLYARIGEEIDALLASDAKVWSATRPYAAREGAADSPPASHSEAPQKPAATGAAPAGPVIQPVTPRSFPSGFLASLRPRDGAGSGNQVPGATGPEQTAIQPGKWRVFLRGILALSFGLIAAGFTTGGLVEFRVLNHSVGGAALLLLWPMWSIAMWFFLPFVGRKVSAVRNSVWPPAPSP